MLFALWVVTSHLGTWGLPAVLPLEEPFWGLPVSVRLRWGSRVLMDAHPLQHTAQSDLCVHMPQAQRPQGKFFQVNRASISSGLVILELEGFGDGFCIVLPTKCTQAAPNK